MECKVARHNLADVLIIIGIYPEWNVKEVDAYRYSKIYGNWNISRMECKVF